MEAKVIVSLCVIYIYIFLKTRNNINKNQKQTWLSWDLFLLGTPLLHFVQNDLGKMAIFIVLSTVCCLIYIYKHKQEVLKEKWKLKTTIVLFITCIPTIIHLFFLKTKYLVGLYVIISLMCYLNDSIVLLINKIDISLKHKK